MYAYACRLLKNIVFCQTKLNSAVVKNGKASSKKPTTQMTITQRLCAIINEVCIQMYKNHTVYNKLASKSSMTNSDAASSAKHYVRHRKSFG